MTRALAFFLASSIPLAACVVHQDDNAGTGASDEGPSGHWTGYIENAQLDDASDTLAVDLESTGNALSGHVRFGVRDLYAPQTDANIGYPPPLEADPHEANQWLTGFEFTMLDPTLENGRLKFSIDPGEIWSSWCALQTPIFDDANMEGYSCLPNTGFATNPSGCFVPNADGAQVDCGKLLLCIQNVFTCSCDANGCSHAAQAPGQIQFDLAVSGASATGSVVGVGLGASTARNIRLDRQ